MNRTLRHLLIWVLTVGVLLMGWKFVTMNMNTRSPQDKAISYSELLDAVNSDKIDNVTVNGDQVFGSYKEGKGDFHIEVPVGPTDSMNLLKDMQAHVLTITVKAPQNNQSANFLIQIVPIAVLVVIGLYTWLVIRRRQRNANKGAGQGPGIGV